MNINQGKKTRVSDYLDQRVSAIDVIGGCFTIKIVLERFNKDAKYRKNIAPYLGYAVDSAHLIKGIKTLQLHVL